MVKLIFKMNFRARASLDRSKDTMTINLSSIYRDLYRSNDAVEISNHINAVYLTEFVCGMTSGVLPRCYGREVGHASTLEEFCPVAKFLEMADLNPKVRWH